MNRGTELVNITYKNILSIFLCGLFLFIYGHSRFLYGIFDFEYGLFDFLYGHVGSMMHQHCA